MSKKTNTLLKVLIFIVIVGLLVIIASNVLRSRRHSSMEACIANMKQLEGARDQALLAGFTVPIQGVPAAHATGTVHAVYGPVATPRPFPLGCPGQMPAPGDPEPAHSVYK